MSRLTDDRIAEIRARLAEATPGPWSQCTDTWRPATPVAVHRIGARDEDIANVYLHRPADADLIAHAPADLADLLDERDQMTLPAYLAERAAEISTRTGWSVVEATSAIEDVAGLITDRDSLTAERDRLLSVVEAVGKIHEPVRVYDECETDDCEADHFLVYDYTACGDSAIGWACETCCYDDEMPIEYCPHGADHRGVTEADACPTHAAIRAYRATTGEAGQ